MQAYPARTRYKTGESVALFLPCYCDLLYPQIGRACVRLFDRLGIPLDYPLGQTCCGQPAFNAGFWSEAAAMAAHFAAVFARYDWIVVPSGSCGAMARVFYAYLDDQSAAARAGAKVYDLATFLVEAAGLIDVGARFAQRVTYLDGCHGRRELGAGTHAVTLLKAVRDLEFLELPHADECCGFGGTFSLKFPELSGSMGAAKCENVMRSGAEVLTSGDASCLMQVAGLLNKAAPPARDVQVLHLAEILSHA
jgi:L-lactate dehydrogenase complex protein LldE